jgi:DNA-binding CsgD family transcriptional regulator
MPRLSSSDLSSLLTELYAMPLDPERWLPFLDRLCDATGSRVGARISVRENLPQIVGGTGEAFDPLTQTLYNSHYGLQDPFAAPSMPRLGEGVLRGDELVPQRELMRSEFFDVLLRPYRVKHLTIVPCQLGAGRIEVLSLWRSAQRGPVDEGSMDTLRQIVPHLRSALLLQEKLEVLKERSLLLDTMLGGLSAPVFLLDGTRLVVALNAAAERLAVQGAEVGMYGRRLRMSHPAMQARFDEMLARAFGTGGDGCRPGAMMVPRRQAGPPLQVIALPSLPEGTAAAGSARVMVFVHDTATRPRPRTELMHAIYALTPAEGRLADLLMQGMEMREIAESMRITLETARFHLKRVMAKTGTRRQVELMRLMLMLPGE